MEGSGSAALVYLVRYYPLASLVPLVWNCLFSFPLKRCVLRPFDAVVLPDHGSVL